MDLLLIYQARILFPFRAFLQVQIADLHSNDKQKNILPQQEWLFLFYKSTKYYAARVRFFTSVQDEALSFPCL